MEVTNSNSDPTPTKRPKNAVGIDMSRVPESLLREGFSEKEEKKISDTFICPVCKELFVKPEMFQCGHTVCVICADGQFQTSYKVCPVCKEVSHGKNIPNVILKQILEEQYPEESKTRLAEMTELKQLKDKLKIYPHSDRIKKLDTETQKYMNENYIMKLSTLVEDLIKSDIQPPVKREEALYFFWFKLSHHFNNYYTVGEYIVKRYDDVDQVMSWIETQKSKKATEMKKWIPLLLLGGMRQIMVSHNSYLRVAKIYKLDIGNEIVIQDLKNHSVTWIKDLELGPALSIYHHHTGCEFGHHHHLDSSSDSDDDDDDEDSDDSDPYSYF